MHSINCLKRALYYNSDFIFYRFRSNITDVTVIRSVSDAVEPSNKYSSMRRCNGFLRRPEILETVYSVEEDGDSENNQDPSESTENSEYEDRRAKNLGNGKGRLQDLYGSFERLAQEADSPPSERPRDESQQAQVKASDTKTYRRIRENSIFQEIVVTYLNWDIVIFEMQHEFFNLKFNTNLYLDLRDTLHTHNFYGV